MAATDRNYAARINAHLDDMMGIKDKAVKGDTGLAIILDPPVGPIAVVLFDDRTVNGRWLMRLTDGGWLARSDKRVLGHLAEHVEAALARARNLQNQEVTP